jgi:hypothetical protein
MFNTFVEELFQSDNPHQLLDDAHDFLDDVSNNKHKDADTMFQAKPSSMFFDDEVEQQVEEEFDAIQEEALNDLVDEL